ncbi:hypothetical protein AB0B78_15690 [Streptomyces sp. NPDC040724]|uniref:hypothetical protein n=1 Tax=unclassified Streptomyces TaxID=2593676 RepID=UPI0034037A90
MTEVIRGLVGAILRNGLLLAAEFGAVLLLRGPEWSWVPVLLAVFVLGAAVPHGTDAEFVARTAVALFAVGIVVLAGITWDRQTLHERGREETAVVASRTMVEDGSGHSPSLRLRTEAGRDLPGPVTLDLQVGARLTVTTDPDGGSWSLGGRPDRPLWQATGTAGLLLLQTVTLGVLCLRRPRT